MNSLQTVTKQQKYGLIIKKPVEKSGNAARKILPKRSIFESLEEDDGDEDADQLESDVKRTNYQLKNEPKNSSSVENNFVKQALNEDSSIFDYDGSYEQFKAPVGSSSVASLSGEKNAPPKSKYVNNLKSMAKVREREQDRIYERKLLKERKLEDQEFGDKPKFMTTAYKKKLEEDKKWEYEDRLEAEVEQHLDVRKRGMQSFYANLLTKNVAMGSDVAENSISAYTAGSGRQSNIIDNAPIVPKEDLTVAQPLEPIQVQVVEQDTILTIEPNKLKTEYQERSSEKEPQDAITQTISHEKSLEDIQESAKSRYLARKIAKRNKDI